MKLYYTVSVICPKTDMKEATVTPRRVQLRKGFGYHDLSFKISPPAYRTYSAHKFKAIAHHTNIKIASTGGETFHYTGSGY